MLYLLLNRFALPASLSTVFSPQLTLESQNRLSKWIFGKKHPLGVEAAPYAVLLLTEEQAPRKPEHDNFQTYHQS